VECDGFLRRTRRFPKHGKHSVGVARQYSGTLGKTGNCQVATSLHYTSTQGEYPLALQVYLPAGWANAPERLEHARVPSTERAFKTKWQIALDLLDDVRAEGLPHGIVLADAGYGVVTEFRDGLDQRREAYVVGHHGDEVVLTEPPHWVPHVSKAKRGRPSTRACLAEDEPRPGATRSLATSLRRTTICWREGLKGTLEADFAWVRVRPDHRWGMAYRLTPFQTQRRPRAGSRSSGGRIEPSRTRTRTSMESGCPGRR
jgi:SRSO17 transposase